MPVLFFNRAIPPALLALNLALKDWNLFSWPFPHQNHRTWGRVTFVAATHARTLCMEPRNHSRGSHRSLSLFDQQQQKLRTKSERIPDKSGTGVVNLHPGYSLFFSPWPVTFYPASFYPVTLYPVTLYPVTLYPASFYPVTLYPVTLLSGHALSGVVLSGHALSGYALSGHALSGFVLSGHALSGYALSGHTLLGQNNWVSH